MLLNQYQISSILSLVLTVITNGCLVLSTKNQKEQIFGRYKPVLLHLSFQDIFLAIMDVVLNMWLFDDSEFMSSDYSIDVKCFILHNLHCFYVDLPLYQVPAFAYSEYILHRNPRYRALPFFAYSTHIITAWLLPWIHPFYTGYKFVTRPNMPEMQHCRAEHVQNTTELLFIGTTQWTTNGYYLYIHISKLILLAVLSCVIHMLISRIFVGAERQRFYREDRCTGGLLRRDAENKTLARTCFIASVITFSTRIALLIAAYGLVQGETQLTGFLPSTVGVVLQLSTSINATCLLLLSRHIR